MRHLRDLCVGITSRGGLQRSPLEEALSGRDHDIQVPAILSATNWHWQIVFISAWLFRPFSHFLRKCWFGNGTLLTALPSVLFLVFQDCWSQCPEEGVTGAAAASGVGRLLDNLFQELGVPGVLSQCILKVKGSKTHSFFHHPFFLSFQWWWSSFKTNECYNWVFTCRIKARYLGSVMGIHTGM